VTLITDYCSLAELKAHLRVTDTADDAILAVDITTASRAIDQHTNRRFGLAPSATARVFTYRGEIEDGDQYLPLDDVQTSTGLVVKTDTAGTYTYATTLVLGTDFDMWPPDAPDNGRPWEGIVLRRTATDFPEHRAAVQVTAQWGWTTVPSVVEIAALVTAARLFVLRDAPLGESGSPNLGNVSTATDIPLDPVVRVSLNSVIRWWGAVAA
jgi:hypothetical protein